MIRKAVFMDIDGTLMQKGVVSERVISAIRSARALGHMFFICTGRSKGYLPEPLRDADYIDGFVMACGMHVEFCGENVYRETIDRYELHRLARYLGENGHACFFDGENKRFGMNTERKDYPRYTDYETIVAELDTEPISKLSIPGVHREEDAAFLGEKYIAYEMGGWVDVVYKGVSKASGMQKMLDHLGISRENSIGIGDGGNDLPMIEYAGFGVAMGNAPDYVKAAADAVTETCENDGVAVMIEKYILKAADHCENK